MVESANYYFFQMKSREFAILSFIIEHFIKTAEPVGSRVLSKIIEIGISASTIRNIMSDLTEHGYIIQPYTSAGRIPTDKGYRYYINHMLGYDSNEEIENLQDLKNSVITPHDRLEDLLKATSHTLAQKTSLTSVILSPRVRASKLKKIEFFNISEQRILVTLVAQSGMVINKMLHVKESLPQEYLTNVSQYLNQIFENCSLSEARQKLVEVLQDEKAEHNEHLAKVIRLGKKAFDFSNQGELFVSGLVNILECPEFEKPGKLQSYYRIFEDKNDIFNIFSKSMDSKGTQVFIGLENGNESMEELSVIVSHYGNKDTQLGSIGLIGPKRMDYSKNINIMRKTADILTNMIQQFI